MVKRNLYTHFSDCLRIHAQHTPHAIACSFLTKNVQCAQDITYQQLDSSARIIAARLQSNQVMRGDRVILLYQPGLALLQALFACFYAGVVAVPMQPTQGLALRQRLIQVIKDCKPHCILLDKKNYDLLHTQFGKAIDLNLCVLTDEAVQPEAHDYQVLQGKPDDLAILQYTSGTTGNPKGVMIKHSHLLANAYNITQVFGDRTHDVGVNWLPPYHDMGLMGALLHGFYIGKRTVLLSPLQFLENPLLWLQAISTFQGTISGGPNFAYRYCVEKITTIPKDLNLRSWEVAFNGAEKIHNDTLEAFSEKFASAGFNPNAFLPCYGLAEATLLVAGRRRGQGARVLAVDKLALQHQQVRCDTLLTKKNIVSCGVPITPVKIVNSITRENSLPQEVGEIWLSGDNVAAGYWQEPAKTKNSFNAAINGESPQRYLRTGDLGFIYNHELYVVGRMKEMIIIRGCNYYPEDIEQTVCDFLPELSGKVVCFGIDNVHQEQLVLIMRTPKGEVSQYKAVLQNIAAKIYQTHQIMPNTIALVRASDIQKTRSGKLKRLACRQNFMDQTLTIVLQQEFTDPCNVLQTVDFKSLNFTDEKTIAQWLQTVVAQALGRPNAEISCTQPLASYGLDSLTAVTLATHLSEQFNTDLSALLFFEYPTIKALAQYLSQSSQRCKNPIRHISSEFEPIAIIGMACRFPGHADTPDAFWELLLTSKNLILNNPRKNSAAGPLNKGGYLKAIDLFAAEFFSIPPQEANLMDPQQRLLLELAWHALEHAGIDPLSLCHSRTGVYIGMSQNDYQQLLYAEQENLVTSAYLATGNAMSAASGRISYQFGLQGPSMTIDTACSSSLVAIDIACGHLQQGQCDLALVGAANLILHPHLTQTLAAAQILSKSGRCKVFDAQAEGYVRSEGAGMIILKSLAKAQSDGDHILAIIRSSTVNQDGRSQGLMAPNPTAQIQLTQENLHKAGLCANDLDYIEAHGTGTVLGDPLEINALAMSFANTNRKQPLFIGSVKSQMGHLEAAAGMASLFKTVLAIKAKMFPAQKHLETLNPLLKLSDIPAEIPTKATPWLTSGEPRRAAINAFGFTGTNAQLIIEEAKQDPTQAFKNTDQRLCLLVLSATTSVALKKLIQSYRSYLLQTEDNIDDICYTSQVGRSHFKYRVAVLGCTKHELYLQLTDKQTLSTAADSVLHVLACSYLQGTTIDWLALHENNKQRYLKVPLPSYPFERKRYWFKEDKLSALLSQAKQAAFANKNQGKFKRLNNDLCTRLCLYYIDSALNTVCNVIPSQQQLFSHLQRVRNQYLAQGLCIPASVEVSSLCQEYPDYAYEIRLAAQCGEQLAEVLQGKIQALTLLFSDTLKVNAGQIYTHASSAKQLHQLLTQVLNKLMVNKRNVRILEVGAGTGATLQAILSVLPDDCHYTFSDISEYFIAKAKIKFSDHANIDYQLLNIEQSPLTQGFYPQQFDIIIATQVLHATEDIIKTVQQLNQVLTSKGSLVLIENTQACVWLDMIFGLLPGWWRFTDKTLRPDYPLLTTALWKKILRANDYADVAALSLPEIGRPSLIVAEYKATAFQRHIKNYNNTRNVTIKAPDKQQDKLSDLSLAECKEKLKHYIADMLHLSPDKISERISFSDLGLDSLMSVELYNHLQQQLSEKMVVSSLELTGKSTIAQLAELITTKLKLTKPTKAKGVNSVILPEFKPNVDKL